MLYKKRQNDEYGQMNFAACNTICIKSQKLCLKINSKTLRRSTELGFWPDINEQYPGRIIYAQILLQLFTSFMSDNRARPAQTLNLLV